MGIYGLNREGGEGIRGNGEGKDEFHATALEDEGKTHRIAQGS